jgi:sugar lactone lactonase YvrE
MKLRSLAIDMTIPQYQAAQILPAQATLGEGPIWDRRCLAYWWIDIAKQKLFQFEPVSKRNLEWQLDEMPGTVVARKSGGLMLSMQSGFAFFDPDSGILEWIADPEIDKPDNRFNDGKCDPAGRFWAGTMRVEEHMKIFTGSLYSLETDGQVTKRLGDALGVPNGIVWSKDASTMYWIDSPRRGIYRFDYDRVTGDIKNQTCIFNAPEEIGFPDGMTIDSDDKLWVAFWGGWCVARICPVSGDILAKVRVPVSAPTACAFGGPNLDQLLITTASIGLSDAERARQPLAGDLFIAQVQAKGMPQPEYAG